MANYKNSKVISLAAPDTVPTSLTPGGQTMSTTGKWVTGVGTSFTTQLAPGAWIVDLATTEIRRVVQVVDNTTALLEQPFTADIAPLTAYRYIPLTFVKELSLVSGGGYSVDGVAIPANGTLTWAKTSGMKDTATNGWVDPVIVTPGASPVIAQLLVYSF